MRDYVLIQDSGNENPERGITPREVEIFHSIFEKHIKVSPSPSAKDLSRVWISLYVSYDDILQIGLEKVKETLAGKLESREAKKIYWHLEKGIPARKCKFENLAVIACSSDGDSCCPSSHWDKCPISGWTINFPENCAVCTEEKTAAMQQISERKRKNQEEKEENSKKKWSAIYADQTLSEWKNQIDELKNKINARGAELLVPFVEQEKKIEKEMKEIETQIEKFWV